MDIEPGPLAAVFHAAVEDLVKARIGISPRITDAELMTRCLMQAMLGYTSEGRGGCGMHAGTCP